MHSSRMHTSHSLTICLSLLLRGGLQRNQRKNHTPSPRTHPLDHTPLVLSTPPRTKYTPSPGLSTPPELSTPPGTKYTPPVNRMTNRCKNITLATTSLRPVTRYVRLKKNPISRSEEFHFVGSWRKWSSYLYSFLGQGPRS